MRTYLLAEGLKKHPHIQKSQHESRLGRVGEMYNCTVLHACIDD